MTKWRATILLLSAAAAWCQTARLSPEVYFRKSMGDPGLRKNGYGEQFCWVAHYYQPAFVEAYQAWKDPAWLDWTVKYDDFLAGKMQTGPDGYKGWIGPYEYDGKVWCDVHVGDALLAGGMLQFAEVVLKDQALRQKYGDAARRYVEIARREVMEKWDRRGTYEVQGLYGAYRSWNRYGEPGELKSWPERNDIDRSGLALPFNKQNEMALVALRLYRITGEEQYRKRAVEIFSYQKSRMQLTGGHYVWNYWEPFSARDIDPGGHKTRHWVNVHPYRNYQEHEVQQMVEAYHTGVVYTREDMERIVNTNLKVMWDGDDETPKFRNSNATLPRPEGAGPRKDTAGTLWTALADFSEDVRDLARRRHMSEIAGAYFENVVAATPAGFARRYVKEPAELPSFPIHECAEMNMATALAGDGVTLLAANLLVPAEIEVTVDGAPVYKGKRSNLVIVPWKAAKPAHTVRWTVNGASYREFRAN
jgi:hypothetical protein